MITDFTKWIEKKKEADKEKRANHLIYTAALAALADITQEINAAMIVMSQPFSNEKPVEIVSRVVDAIGNTAAYELMELLEIHGNNLLNASKALEECVRVPNEEEQKEIDADLKAYFNQYLERVGKTLIEAYIDILVEGGENTDLNHYKTDQEETEE